MFVSLDHADLFAACERAGSAAPRGYSVVINFWRKYESEALDLLLDPVAAHFHDAEKLQTMCEQRGLAIHYIPSPPELAACGIHEMRAFPLAVLHEFYAKNP